MKQTLINQAKNQFSSITNYGTRCVYKNRHFTLQIHYCQKSDCTFEQFLLSTLRFWESFIYYDVNEFLEDLEVCKFLEIKVKDAKKQYSVMCNSINQLEVINQPPCFEDFGDPQKLILISDKWNYNSFAMVLENVFIACHWDTAE